MKDYTGLDKSSMQERSRTMEGYKKRMVEEYRELREKYVKLHRMIVKYEAGKLEFELTCPVEILKQQASAMGKYLYTLEVRAQIEGIKLEGETC